MNPSSIFKVPTQKKMHVRRPPNKRLDPKYCKGTVKHGGGNVMVWGCFSLNGIGPLHEISETMDRYIYKNILESVMLPFAEEKMPTGWIFQQDNDPKHTSKVVKTWFQDKKVDVLKWPAQSPDLNPIENLWDMVDRKIKRDQAPNKRTFFFQIKQAWESISNKQIEKLIDSMPRRCSAVLKNNGYATKY